MFKWPPLICRLGGSAKYWHCQSGNLVLQHWLVVSFPVWNPGYSVGAGSFKLIAWIKLIDESQRSIPLFTAILVVYKFDKNTPNPIREEGTFFVGDRFSSRSKRRKRRKSENLSTLFTCKFNERSSCFLIQSRSHLSDNIHRPCGFHSPSLAAHNVRQAIQFDCQ